MYRTFCARVCACDFSRGSVAMSADHRRKALGTPHWVRTAPHPSPPTEVASLWLGRCDLVSRMRCMRVCTAWCAQVKDCGLWHDISIGHAAGCFHGLGGWHCLVGTEEGVPRLFDHQMDAMLSHANGQLRTLTLVKVANITSCAFYALRASPLLESVTVLGSPQVCNNIALALPPTGRVHTLALGCAKVNGLIAQMLPSTVRTLRLTGSGVRTADARQLQTSRSGLDVDLTVCAGCDAPAPKDALVTCSRCSLIGCSCRALSMEDDSRVVWRQIGCDRTSVCWSCGQGRLCEECDDRDECELCEEERICADCVASAGHVCTCCRRLCCKDCAAHTCDGCDAMFCGSCDNEDDTYESVAKLCAISGRRLCPSCQPARWELARHDDGNEFMPGKCDGCSQFVGAAHGMACACSATASTYVLLCTRCVSRGQRCWVSPWPSRSYALQGMADVCASADCRAVVCEDCSSACAVCGMAFCSACAESVDDAASAIHSEGKRARLCAMGFSRPFACAECGKMYCDDCESSLTCSFCGLVSCASCERVQVCDGCDQRVCRFCDGVERMGSCCSLTAGWLGEEIHLSSAQVVTDAVGSTWPVPVVPLGRAWGWGCVPAPSSAHTCQGACGFACATCDQIAASLSATIVRKQIASSRPNIAICELLYTWPEEEESTKERHICRRENEWLRAYDEHEEAATRAREAFEAAKTAAEERRGTCSVCTFRHSALASHCPRCGFAAADGTPLATPPALKCSPKLEDLPDFSLTRARLLCPIHTCMRLRAHPPSNGYVEVFKEVTRRVAGQLHWQSEWVLVVRLPLTRLNRFVQYRADEWTVRLVGPARLLASGEGTSASVAPTFRRPLPSDELRVHLQPPRHGSLWPTRRAGEP